MGEILEEVLEDMFEFEKKHKYLPLIYAMKRTRGDWSNGFGLVRDALSNFEVKTDIDKKIHANIEYCLGDSDGRIFRDCTYNYDVLKDMLPGDLAKEFEELYRKVIKALY